MGLIDIIKEMLNRGTANRMQQRVEVVKGIYEESDTEKEAIQKATDKVIQEIKAYPNMPVTEFLTMIQKELSTNVIVETTKQIPEEETAVEIVQKMDLPSKGIQEIIQETDISINSAKKMTAEISDETIQKEERKRLERIEREKREEERQKKEKRLKEELRKKYSQCDEISGLDLIRELKDIKEQSTSSETYSIIKRVLARKAAIEWRQSGNTRIPTMTEVISAEEMMEEDFPALVGIEFEEVRKINRYQGPNDYQYTEEDLERLILMEIAKEVVETHNKVGIIDIPQSERMKNLTKEQEEFLIQEIQKYGKEIADVDKMRRQIRGIKDDELEDLQKLVEKIPEDERKDYINRIKKQMQKGKQVQLDSKVEEMLEELREQVKDLDKKEVLEILEETIEDIQDRKKEINRSILSGNDEFELQK